MALEYWQGCKKLLFPLTVVAIVVATDFRGFRGEQGLDGSGEFELKNRWFDKGDKGAPVPFGLTQYIDR